MLILKIRVNIHWNILYTNSSNWKWEYFNVQKITSSRLNLYHSFTTGMPRLGFLYFLSFFFSHGSLALLCHRAKMKEKGKLTLNMRPSCHYQFPNLTNNFCTQLRVCWIPRCTPWLYFSTKESYILMWCCSGQHFTLYSKKDRHLNELHNCVRSPCSRLLKKKPP